MISNARSGRSVASMSLGSGYNQATNDAVNAMVDAGIQTAVAAGNDNADACNYSPASAAKVWMEKEREEEERRLRESGERAGERGLFVCLFLSF